jgi:hypothetical protein
MKLGRVAIEESGEKATNYEDRRKDGQQERKKGETGETNQSREGAPIHVERIR